MDIYEILQVLPHRYPFLLVDRIIELEPGTRALGLKNVTINEPFFSGHFPGRPIMPGVLLIEAMAQVGACALFSQEKYQGPVGVPGRSLICASNVRQSPAILYVSTRSHQTEEEFWLVQKRNTRPDDLICRGELMFGLEKSSRKDEYV